MEQGAVSPPGNHMSDPENKNIGKRKRRVNAEDKVVDLVLDKLSLSEDNARAGKVVNSEKVETELGTFTVKGHVLRR